ncbi:MAG: methylisocitrate lyase [Pseudomonadota bacterium]|nr:methylisocitrate lyase [Pseudomonadota bacterium]
MTVSTAGNRIRAALTQEQPLQIVGAINAYAALMAEQVGFRCLYLSGGGVAAASYGLPDLGITSMQDVITDALRITDATDTPLLVDIDTGWGGAFNIARTIREMEKAGVGAVHIEDQVAQKRCGHRPNKAIVSAEEMCDRIKAAVDAKIDPSFILMARTDALAIEGFNGVVDRAQEYVEAGADAIFAEAMTDVSMYGEIVDRVDVPVLANLTEFGATPLYSVDELRQVGVHMALYPLSAFRAMSLAALNIYKEIRAKGSQRDVVASMQTRDQLYEFLGYHEFERKLDELFKEGADNAG